MLKATIHGSRGVLHATLADGLSKSAPLFDRLYHVRHDHHRLDSATALAVKNVTGGQFFFPHSVLFALGRLPRPASTDVSGLGSAPISLVELAETGIV